MLIRAPLSAGLPTNKPDLIVVHAMGEFIRTEDQSVLHATTFLGSQGLSAHRLVHPSGDVYVCREDEKGAFHAKGFNQNSLGLEFLVGGVHDWASFKRAIREPDWVTEEAFDAGARQVANWMGKFKIPLERVKRHSDIDPERKVDPGVGFPWDFFLNRVQQLCQKQPKSK